MGEGSKGSKTERNQAVNLSIEDLGQLFSEAVAAEAEATGNAPDHVATQWALAYADAALAVFEQYRPHNPKAHSLLRAARAWLATQSPKALQEFNRARSTFFSRPGCGKYKAAIHASQAIIKAANAVNHSFPIDCLLDAAVYLSKAEAYARRHEHA